MRTVAVLPAYNEEKAIAATVRAVRSIRAVDYCLVVDDGSTDGTAEEAARAGARVLRLEKNLGKAGAVAEGIAASGGDVILILDADLGDTAVEAEKLLGPVLSGEAGMTIARFETGEGTGGFGLVKGLARVGLRLLTGQVFEEPLSGQRCLRRRLWEELPPPCGGFGLEFGLTVDVHRRGEKILELPVRMRHRRTGRDLKGFLHRARQGLAVLRAFFRKGALFWRTE